MKFGRLIRERAFPSEPWNSAYVDYKVLKEIIKAIEDNNEYALGKHLATSAQYAESLTDTVPVTVEQLVIHIPPQQVQAKFTPFFQALSVEIAKVEQLYRNQIKDFSARFSPLVQSIKTILFEQRKLDSTSLNEFTDLCQQLDMLRSFVVLNYLAFVKILKKFDKKLRQGMKEHTLLSIRDRPFYASKELAALLSHAECIADVLAGCPSSDEPDGNQQCHICKQELSNAVVLSCGHRFCWHCLAKKSLFGEQCPICAKSQSLHPEDYRVDSSLQAFLQLHLTPSPDELKADASSNRPPSPAHRPAIPQHKMEQFMRIVDILSKDDQKMQSEELTELARDSTSAIDIAAKDLNVRNAYEQQMEAKLPAGADAKMTGVNDDVTMQVATSSDSISMTDATAGSTSSAADDEAKAAHESPAFPPIKFPLTNPLAVNNIACLLRHANRRSMIVVDIDETLVMTSPDSSMMSSYGIQMFQKYLQQHGFDYAAKVRHCQRLQRLLDAKVLVEPTTSMVIRKLQQAGCWVFGLTARYASMAPRTQMTLFRLGIDLNIQAPLPKGQALQDPDTKAMYSNGVIYTNAIDKGDVLNRFLENVIFTYNVVVSPTIAAGQQQQSDASNMVHAPSPPQHGKSGIPEEIVFIDDRMQNSQSVLHGLTIARKHNVNVVSYHYTGAERAAPDDRTRKLIRVQIKSFIDTNGKTLLTDEQAAAALSTES
jgi:Protein of unknown function (DUF2608)/SPX domain/Zinc finger, C3HC4 type (RING finger)